MSIPWGFKKYIDEVYMSGHGKLTTGDGRSSAAPEKGYGRGGLLKSRYMLVTTWNAPKGAFNDKAEFFEGKSVDGVFFNFHKCQQFCGMKKLPSFSCHDVMKNPDVGRDLDGSGNISKRISHELVVKWTNPALPAITLAIFAFASLSGCTAPVNCINVTCNGITACRAPKASPRARRRSQPIIQPLPRI